MLSFRVSNRFFLLLLLNCPAIWSGCTANSHLSKTSIYDTLDWNARYRLVHIDHVDLMGVEVFEGARKRWLAALGTIGAYQPDGRPLLWSGNSDKDQIYFTFYPFNAWSDLDRRSELMRATDVRMGDSAVNDYDKGDAALVPPHHSEVWRHLNSADIRPSDLPLSERTAAWSRIEYRRNPTGAESEELDSLWQEVQKSLLAMKYHGTCEVYIDSYGGGELVLWWLGTDRASVSSPNVWTNTLRSSPGGNALVQRIEKLIPIQRQIIVERREDLSHMPKKR